MAAINPMAQISGQPTPPQQHQLGTQHVTHPGHQAQTAQPQQQPNVSDTDPLVKYQNLLPILKESTANLLKHTVHILQNTSNGQCRQSDVQLLNKCMEDFYNISDQVYHWLALADSTVAQYLMGTKFSTVTSLTSSFNTPAQQQQQQGAQPQQQQQLQQGSQQEHKDVLFYSQYLSNAKRQVAATNDIRNMLTNFADSLGKDEIS